MKRFFLLLGLLLAANIYGQTQTLRIVDENSQPIEGVLAINFIGKEYGPSNAKGIIDLPYEAGSQFQIFKEGYFIKLIELNWDVLYEGRQVDIQLEKNDIELLTVEVSAAKVPFTDTLRVRDFELQDSLLLVLGYDYIVLANLDWRVLLYLPNNYGFESLEKDPRGNIFLLAKDSVVQVYLSREMLYFYPAVSRSQYIQFIEPLMAVDGERLIIRNNKIESMPIPISEMRAGTRGKAMSFPLYHNQGVQMFIYEAEKEPREFYHVVDTQSVIYAHDAFMEAFNIAAGMERLFDEFGIWDHRKLIDLAEKQKIYQRAFSKYRPVQVFPYQSGFLVFDHFIDKLRFLKGDGSLIWERDFVIDKEFINPIIIQDHLSESLFALRRMRGSVFIHPIEDFKLGRGVFVELFAKETKVRGSDFYFIDESNYLVRKNLKD